MYSSNTSHIRAIQFTNSWHYNARCNVQVEARTRTEHWYAQGELAPTSFKITNRQQTYTIQRQQGYDGMATSSGRQHHRPNLCTQRDSGFGSFQPCAFCNNQHSNFHPLASSTPRPLNSFGIAPLTPFTHNNNVYPGYNPSFGSSVPPTLVPNNNVYIGSNPPFGSSVPHESRQFNDYSSNSGNFETGEPAYPYLSGCNIS